jgi:hypothetical protein
VKRSITGRQAYASSTRGRIVAAIVQPAARADPLEWQAWAGAPHVLLSFPKRFIESRRAAPAAEHEHPGVGVQDADLFALRFGP